MNQKLFAFWKHDVFPGYLGGQVDKMDATGRVYIGSYQGWFRPRLILPLEEGSILREKLDALYQEYHSRQTALSVEMNGQVQKLMRL